MSVGTCLSEAKRILSNDGRRVGLGIDEKLGSDYEIVCKQESITVRACRLRDMWRALGDMENTVLSGRRVKSKRVESPLKMRLVEAWAPMHSHRCLPMPEYHETTWHVRLRMTDFQKETSATPAPLLWGRRLR